MKITIEMGNDDFMKITLTQPAIFAEALRQATAAFDRYVAAVGEKTKPKKRRR